MYIGMLASVTECALSCKGLRDVILTPFALLWMLWPSIVAYLLREVAYYIAGGLLSTILLVVG